MSFSFLGGLASLLPGYLQGQRMANQDNWQDLMNYNKAQQGQLSNAFTEATWQPRLNMMRNAMYDSTLQTYGNVLNAQQKAAIQPWEIMQRQAWSQYGPWLAPMGPQAQWDTWQLMQSQPNLMLAMGGSGKTPSALGG